MPELTGRERDPSDYYATTPELAELCCRTLKTDFIARPRRVLEPSTILEPTCGSGSWLPGIRSTWPGARIHAVEKHPDLGDYTRGRGFSVEVQDVFRAQLGTYDLIVGNPPFSLADDLIPMLISRLNPGGVLAFLLRLNFFAGQERYERLWRIFPATAAYPLPARPGFTPDGGSDGTDYMMCVWTPGWQGPTLLRHLDNRFVRVKWTGTKQTPDPSFPDPRTGPPVPVRGPRHAQAVLGREASR